MANQFGFAGCAIRFTQRQNIDGLMKIRFTLGIITHENVKTRAQAKAGGFVIAEVMQTKRLYVHLVLLPDQKLFSIRQLNYCSWYKLNRTPGFNLTINQNLSALNKNLRLATTAHYVDPFQKLIKLDHIGLDLNFLHKHPSSLLDSNGHENIEM